MDTIYIDPTYTGSVQNGSIENPLTGWNDIQFESDTNYLQKRGTEFTCEKQIIFSHSNVKIGAYGEGERPIIISIPNTKHDIIRFSRCDGTIIKDIKLVGEIGTMSCIAPSGHWTSGTLENPTPSTTNTLIRDCVMFGGFNNIRILGYSSGVKGVKIENCEFFMAMDNEIGLDKTEINVEDIDITNSPPLTIPTYPPNGAVGVPVIKSK